MREEKRAWERVGRAESLLRMSAATSTLALTSHTSKVGLPCSRCVPMRWD